MTHLQRNDFKWDLRVFSEWYCHWHIYIYIDRPNESSIAIITPSIEDKGACTCYYRGHKILAIHAIPSDLARFVCDSVGAC